MLCFSDLLNGLYYFSKVMLCAVDTYT